VAKVKRTKEEMKITLKNKNKVAIDFPRNAFKKKNRAEEGGASSLEMKREQDIKDLKARKVMKGRVEPSIMPIMVREVPTMVHVVRQIVAVPQMTFPYERQSKE
jgi:hypothetical protein